MLFTHRPDCHPDPCTPSGLSPLRPRHLSFNRGLLIRARSPGYTSKSALTKVRKGSTRSMEVFPSTSRVGTEYLKSIERLFSWGMEASRDARLFGQKWSSGAPPRVQGRRGSQNLWVMEIAWEGLQGRVRTCKGAVPETLQEASSSCWLRSEAG